MGGIDAVFHPEHEYVLSFHIKMLTLKISRFFDFHSNSAFTKAPFALFKHRDSPFYIRIQKVEGLSFPNWYKTLHLECLGLLSKIGQSAPLLDSRWSLQTLCFLGLVHIWPKRA